MLKQAVDAVALVASVVVTIGMSRDRMCVPAGVDRLAEHVGLPTRDATNERIAADVVEREINERWAEVGGTWTTKFQRKNAVGDVLPGEPDLLYRQMRELGFSLEPIELSTEANADGVQFAAIIAFHKTEERYYRRVDMEEGPKGWSTWRDAALGSSATVVKRNGKWSIHGTDLFEGVKPNASKIPPG